MKRILHLLFLVPYLASSIQIAKADIVVRAQETSENEFQSLAQALGHTPVSDFLTSADRPAASLETTELFRARLIEAQAEWLSRGDGLSSTPAIDRFLSLSTEADWTALERKALITFFIRKLELTNGADEVRRSLRAFVRGEALDLQEMSNANKVKWRSLEKQDLATWMTFPSALPVDVTAILVNGIVIARRDATGLKIPRVATRMTFISNAHQPTTLKLNGDETDWPAFSRQLWIANDCSIARPSTLAAGAAMTALGTERCHPGKPNLQTAKTDRELIEKFGLERVQEGAPPPPPVTSASVFKNPWLWGVVGVVAVGAAIAIARSQNQDSVRPTASDGW